MMAAYYSLIAFIIYLARGSQPFEDLGATVGGTFAAYWAGGLLGGFLLGLAFPLARNTIGSIGVGILVAVPAFAGISLASSGKLNWVVILICAGIFGTIGGLVNAAAGGPSWDEINQMQDDYEDRIAAVRGRRPPSR